MNPEEAVLKSMMLHKVRKNERSLADHPEVRQSTISIAQVSLIRSFASIRREGLLKTRRSSRSND